MNNIEKIDVSFIELLNELDEKIKKIKNKKDRNK